MQSSDATRWGLAPAPPFFFPRHSARLPLDSMCSWKRRRMKASEPVCGEFKHGGYLFHGALRSSCPEIMEYQEVVVMKDCELNSMNHLVLKEPTFALLAHHAELEEDESTDASDKQMVWCENITNTTLPSVTEKYDHLDLCSNEEIAVKDEIFSSSMNMHGVFRVENSQRDVIREGKYDSDVQTEDSVEKKINGGTSIRRGNSIQDLKPDKKSMPYEVGASIFEPPYYSGWEDLSIEEMVENMNGVYSAEKYVEKCICLLQMCRRNKCFTTASHAYTHICNNGLEAHGLFGSYLVSMFLECGSLSMAQVVFNKASYHNEYSWTCLIQGYIGEGDPEHSLSLFWRMLETRVRPSKYTYVAVLTICARLSCIERGFQIHAAIVKEGFDEELFVARSVVDFYAKCGLISEAQMLFDKLSSRESHFFNSIDARNIDPEMDKTSVADSENVQGGLPRGAAIFVYNLKACCSVRDLQSGRELHLEILKEGFDVYTTVCNTLIDMYAKCGSIYEAFRVLLKMSNRDVISWTSLIMGCVEYGLVADALKCLERMQDDNVCPNSFTYVSCLKACGIIQALDIGRRLHIQIMKMGCYMDFVVCNSLIDMYAKCASLEEAQNIFDKLAIQDIIGWTSLIAGYAEHGPREKAIECFRQMRVEGVTPNAITFVCCLKASASMRDLEMGQKLHKYLVEDGLEGYKVVGNTLLSMYARVGLYEEARSVLYELPGRDVISWTALICEYAEDSLGEEALNTLEEMLNEGFSPNSVTYMCCLKACGSIGALKKGRMLHMDIIKSGLENNSYIRNALVDMYAECGQPLELDDHPDDPNFF